MKIFPWQENLWKIFTSQNSKTPHALLITGLEGTGKYHFLEHLAQFLLCDTKKSTPCNNCLSCHWFRTHSHPDFFPLDGKQGILKIDQIRELRNWLKLTPYNQNRVLLINKIEQLNLAAQNAFLKILEEPPPQVYFLLSTTNLTALLPTLLSRCQRFHMLISKEATEIWLKENTIPFHLTWLQDTPLRITEYHQRYGNILPIFLDQLNIFLKDPKNLYHLQNTQNQFALEDLIELYYQLLYQSFTQPEALITPWLRKITLQLPQAFKFEELLQKIKKAQQERVCLNTTLVAENLALQFANAIKLT